MKNLKKVLAMVLASVMVLSMAACGAKEEAAEAPAEEAPAEEEAKEEAPAEEKPKKLTKKQALQAKADELGISYTQKNTIAELEAMIAEAE